MISHTKNVMFTMAKTSEKQQKMVKRSVSLISMFSTFVAIYLQDKPEGKIRLC